MTEMVQYEIHFGSISQNYPVLHRQGVLSYLMIKNVALQRLDARYI